MNTNPAIDSPALPIESAANPKDRFAPPAGPIEARHLIFLSPGLNLHDRSVALARVLLDSGLWGYDEGYTVYSLPLDAIRQMARASGLQSSWIPPAIGDIRPYHIVEALTGQMISSYLADLDDDESVAVLRLGKNPLEHFAVSGPILEEWAAEYGLSTAQVALAVVDAELAHGMKMEWIREQFDFWPQ